MTTALPQITGQDLLTNSRMTCRKSCARKHHYRYNLGIRKGDTAKPLRMGSAVHLGLECLAGGCSFDHAAVAALADYEVLPRWANTDEKVHEWLVERETVANLLAGYHWYYEDDPDIAEYIAPEFSFEHPIRNPDTGSSSRTFRVAGKIDGIVRLKDGRLAVLEHKTTGDDIGPDSDYWKKLTIDQQISLYMVAARLSGHDVETVLYDVIRKPSIAPRQVPMLDGDGLKIVLDENGERVLKSDGKPRQSGDTQKGWKLLTQTESAETFGDRLRQDIAERPDFYFQRREIPRLASDLAEFEHELWQQSVDIRESINTGRHYRNTSACTLMGTCEYIDLCARGLGTDEVPSGFVRVSNVNPELGTGDE